MYQDRPIRFQSSSFEKQIKKWKSDSSVLCHLSIEIYKQSKSQKAGWKIRKSQVQTQNFKYKIMKMKDRVRKEK